MALLVGIHPVREALRAGRPLDRVLVAQGAGGAKVQEIIEQCRQRGVPVRFEPRAALDRTAGGAAHQGVVAFAAARPYRDLADVLSARALVLLDGVQDPHNLGAIIRTAHAAGVDAVLIPQRRSAGLSETVEKAAAGALAYTPVVRIGNVAQTLRTLKDRGFWIYGFDERGTEAYDQVLYHAPTVFVLGGEGEGLHRLVARRCDLLVRIPLAGGVSSLNVSVAAGIALFEWRRRLKGQ